jgi:hypothetical protein
MLGRNLNRTLEGDHLPFAKPILPSDFSHSSEVGEELARGIRPSLSAPVDLEKSSIEGPLGIDFNEDGGRFVCRVGHPYALLQARFGAEQIAEKPTLIKRLFRCRKLGSSQVNAL